MYREVLKWGRLRAAAFPRLRRARAEQASNKERAACPRLRRALQVCLWQTLRVKVTATGSKRRRRLPNIPARSFSDSLTFFMEKYSSGRRGVTRKQTDFVTIYFPKPVASLAFTELKRRESKWLVCSFLSKFRQLNNTEKYSSGERADRRRWRMKEGERVAACPRLRRALQVCPWQTLRVKVTATGSKRRRRFPNIPTSSFSTI